MLGALGFLNRFFSLFVGILASGIANNGRNFSDCASRSVPSDDPFENMCYLTLQNANTFDNHYSYESGHPGFHNHLAYHLVALYRLGANATHLQKTFNREGQTLGPAVPSMSFIDDSNWIQHVGAWQRGEVANTSIHYSDYVEFFRGKVHLLGEQSTLEWALPHVVDGLAGDLFHPVIQLSYFFESGDAELLAEGLAWMATGFEALGPLNPAPHYTDIRRAMADLQSDDRLPYGASVSELCARYGSVLAEYDLLISNAPTQAVVEEVVRQVSLFASDLFASDGYSSFTLLHVVTGTRAMQATVASIQSPSLRAQFLRRHWSGVLYYYVSWNRPMVTTPQVEEPLRLWGELEMAAIAVPDAHLVKLVYLSRENDLLWDVPLYRQIAERIVARFESGRGWSHQHPADPNEVEVPAGWPKWLGPVIAVVLACVVLGFVGTVVLWRKTWQPRTAGADASMGASLQVAGSDSQ